MTIEGVSVNGENVKKAIEKFYPETFKTVEQNKLFGYFFLFGIRVSTCDTAVPDDIIGGIRFVPTLFGDGEFEIEVSDGTTDPSPYYMKNIFDSEARAKGGTAWMKEGQYLYRLYGDWKGYPAFAPVNATPVYRWMPRTPDEKFDPTKARLSDSVSCLIHRSWGKEKFYKDSAGCQVLKNNESLKVLEKWAKGHLRLKNYPRYFKYTLLTKEQFLAAAEKTIKDQIFSFPNLF
jgi:hypothetical protein